MTPWTFAHVADIQVGSPRSFRFAPAWNENWETARAQIVGIRPEFLLVGGDLTRDGSFHRFELEAVKEDFDALPFPVHVIPGNMDTGNKHTRVPGPRKDRDDLSLNITSEQVRQFESVFGPARWSFDHKGVRFSGFCDMLVGSGLPEEDELWEWMEGQARRPPAAHHVWITHYPLFIDDLHEPNWDIADPDAYFCWYFGLDEPGRSRVVDIFKRTGADLVISGHIHNRKTRVADGIRFDSAPATCMSQFADRWPDGDPTLGFTRYEVRADEIEGTFVPLERVSTRKGYGPGGHPLPEARDYSLAWEKE
jgi:hypothetical protein